MPIESLTNQGQLISECALPGERRTDMIAPAHGNGIQLSKDRFLLLNSTLGFDGVDDNRSVAYQLRAGSFDGVVVKEGMLAKSIDGWEPWGNDEPWISSAQGVLRQQFGHPVAMGVPKGAMRSGRLLPHHNHFALMVRVVARLRVPAGYLMFFNEPPEIRLKTQDVWWLQFRLNDTDDDIEIVSPFTPLRQVGHQGRTDICERHVTWMNQTYVQPVRLDESGTEWGVVNHFGQPPDSDGNDAGMAIGVLRFSYSDAAGCYQWVETGPLHGPFLFEASLAPWQGKWVVAARLQKPDVGVAWALTDDPMAELDFVIQDDIGTRRSPLGVYGCPDGVIRLVSGDQKQSPYQQNRNPLYLSDIDPGNGFMATTSRLAFDSFEQGVEITMDHHPIVDMGKLLPHCGGREQLLIHRVRSIGCLQEEGDFGGPLRILTEGDFRSTAIYAARLTYSESLPGEWSFT